MFPQLAGFLGNPLLYPLAFGLLPFRPCLPETFLSFSNLLVIAGINLIQTPLNRLIHGVRHSLLGSLQLPLFHLFLIRQLAGRILVTVKTVHRIPGICQELYIIRNCLSHLHFLLMGTFIITYSLLQIIPTGKGCYKKFKYGRNMTNTGTAPFYGHDQRAGSGRYFLVALNISFTSSRISCSSHFLPLT